MAEQITPEFKHEVLEADMKRLAEEVMRYRENPESKHLSEQELLKKSIRSVFPVTKNTPAPQNPQSPLPDYVEGTSVETKLEVEYLIDLAFHQGIHKANAAARGSNSFVLDAFHDALVGKLYLELKERGLLK
mgnify:CR=1 FL=1